MRKRLGSVVLLALGLGNAWQCGRNYELKRQHKFLVELKAQRDSTRADSIVTIDPDVIAETFPRRDAI